MGAPGVIVIGREWGPIMIDMRADIGAAIERGLDFLDICYDNEGYGNTGQQASASTPDGARTTTTSDGNTGWKKNLFSIWVAHRPAYAATVIGPEPLDLAKNIQRALTFKGPRLIYALSPCPTGWLFDPSETVEIGRLAVRSGIFPLAEYVDGKLTHTRVMKPRLPVTEYLQREGRFAHLLAPTRNNRVIEEIQNRVDMYWREQEVV